MLRRVLPAALAAAACLTLAACGEDGRSQTAAQPTSAWEAEAAERQAAEALRASAAASSSSAAARSSAAAAASAAAASIAARPENQFQTALRTAGLTYSTPTAQSICETLRTGGLPGDEEGRFAGRTPAEYFVVNENVGSGDANSRSVMLAVQYRCPDQQYAVDQALSGNYPVAVRSKFPQGSYRVGVDMPPGTYRSVPASPTGVITDCYWERSAASGGIIANDFASGAAEISVAVRASDAVFTTSGCPAWTKVA